MSPDKTVSIGKTTAYVKQKKTARGGKLFASGYPHQARARKAGGKAFEAPQTGILDGLDAALKHYL
jgi:hypothetical protein